MRSIFFSSVLLLLSSTLLLAVQSLAVPLCTAKQISIQLIAVDRPGMMHVNTLHGIINNGSQPCLLIKKPTKGGSPPCKKVDIGGNGFKIICYQDGDLDLSGDTMLIEPTSKKRLISSDKLVWFSTEGTDADVAGDNGKDVKPFNTTEVSLPGVPKVYKIKIGEGTTAFDGFSSIQKNAANWQALKNDQCEGFNGKTWIINTHSTANCG